ncbi:Wiskott-Aldrich syndrome protein family member 3 [Trichinella sp. T6]|nr:Wiskott-Aldrich syndrome protein family member 3 [Trichinella sp. T6]
MPLTKREVSPVLLCRHRLPSGVRDKELQCIANGTLANLIRQLGSLSSHAEDLFAELSKDLIKIEHRTNLLQTRLDSLGQKVNDLDSGIDETSIRSFYLRKPFKSKPLIDQQSLSRHTMPTAMGLRYQRCCPPPRLDKLDCFRDDGKSAMKFYTDPDYFFELWRCEMLSNGDNAKRATKANAKLKDVHDGRKRTEQLENRQQAAPYLATSRKNLANADSDLYIPLEEPIFADQQQRIHLSQNSSSTTTTTTAAAAAADNENFIQHHHHLHHQQQQQMSALQRARAVDVAALDAGAQKVIHSTVDSRTSSTRMPADYNFPASTTTTTARDRQQSTTGLTKMPTSRVGTGQSSSAYPYGQSGRWCPPTNDNNNGAASNDQYSSCKSPLRPSQPPPLPPGQPLSTNPLDVQSSSIHGRPCYYGDQELTVRMENWHLGEDDQRRQFHETTVDEPMGQQFQNGHRPTAVKSVSPELPPPPPPLSTAHLFVASFILAMTFFSIAQYDIIDEKDEILNPNNTSSSTPRQCSSRCSLLQFSGGEMNQPLLTALRRFTNNQQLLANLLEQTAGGKGIRGRLLTGALEANVLFDDRTSLAQKAHTIASAVEMLHAGFLIQDDIMDNASTRRGKPCWYRQVGLSGINDGVLLQSAASWLPSVVLDDHPQKHAIVSSFVEATVITSLGQKLDMEKARPDTCSWDRYRELVTNKTAHYSFWFPLKVGLLLADIQLEEVEIELKNICYEFGFYFQAKDDYLNCFGDEWVTKKHSSDIACGKLTWLLLTAVDMSKLDGDRLKIIWQNYAQSEQRMIQEVRSLYEQLDLRGKFQLFEQAVVEKLSTLVSRLKMPQLCPVLFEMLHLIKNQ